MSLCAIAVKFEFDYAQTQTCHIRFVCVCMCVCLVKRKTLDQLNFIKFNFAKKQFTNWDTPEAKQVQRNPRAATLLGDIYSVGKKNTLQSRNSSVGYSWGVCLI